MKNQLAVDTNRSNHRVSILIADDLNEWRAQIHKILQARPEWLVIGEAIDGLQAVQKASELQPDIVLLDIGMPSLNGIEAAKIIRHRCPKSKILFVTQNGDADVRNEAMRTGAAGFVLKANAAHEIVNVIAAVLNQ